MVISTAFAARVTGPKALPIRVISVKAASSTKERIMMSRLSPNSGLSRSRSKIIAQLGASFRSKRP
ncbi:hypothetical protein D3C87_1664780 [compost metagenome]